MAVIAVLGAGSWGTALAIQLARSGQASVLWGRDHALAAAMQAQRCNPRYLPGARFPDSLTIEPDLERAVSEARDVLVAVPSHAFRGLLAMLRDRLPATTRLAWATKGFEIDTGKLPHAVAAELLGTARPMAVLSGPTFAREVGAGLPTAMTVASTDGRFAEDLARSLSGEQFRVYTSNDLIGVQAGGAIKNVIAIGAGISDGLGFGANTRVALITRGLAEMTRLGVALGSRPETLMGLAGLGDLVLTCTDDASRNRRFGLSLARGAAVEAARKAIGQVVEGVPAALAVRQVAEDQRVEMPICEQVYRVLYEGVSPQDGVKTLMGRALKPEIT